VYGSEVTPSYCRAESTNLHERRQIIRNFVYRASIGLALLLNTACPKTDSTAPDPNALTAPELAVQGQYTLSSVNGAALPTAAGTYPAGNVTCSRFIDGGFLNLATGPHFSLSVSWRILCPSGVNTTSTTTGVQSINGTWVYDGSSITLTRTDGSPIVVSNQALANGVFSALVQLETNPAGAANGYPLLTMRFSK